MTDWATRSFSLDRGGDILRTVFGTVTILRPPVRSAVIVRDAQAVADYVGSVADAYAHEVRCSWAEVVGETREAVQVVIDRQGSFTTEGETGAFVCR